MPGNPNNLGVGDIVMSMLPLKQFRLEHGDTDDKNPSWVECDGTDVANTHLGKMLAAHGSPTTNDFSARYPRAYDGNAAGTLLSASAPLQDHSHTVGVNYWGGGLTGNANVRFYSFPADGNLSTTITSSGASGANSVENRPNSFVVHFYVRIR